MKNIFTIICVFLCISVFAQQPCDKCLPTINTIDSAAYYHAKYDSIYSKHLVLKFKMERIKYYVGICNRNPKQTVFLRGWMNRVLKK